MPTFPLGVRVRKLFSFRTPAVAGRGLTPTLALVVALICSVCVVATAVVWAGHAGKAAIAQREHLIASDMVESIDRILDTVTSRRHNELLALVGQPCPSVATQLAELEADVQYVRGIFLVAHRTVYCSSIIGPVDMPLAGYIPSSASGITLSLDAGTPQEPDVPIVSLFMPAGPDTGLLYTIDAAYLDDALAHGVRYEADQVVLVVANARALNARGEVMPADAAAALRGTRASSPRWAFSVVVVASSRFISQTHLKFGLLAAGIAFLLNLLIAAVYLIVFAPRRLLLNAVRRGLKAGEMYVVYQPVVEIATRRIEGVEALIRWTTPKWGVVNPGVFMEEVERSSLLANVTRFMLERASAEITQQTAVRPLRLAVNIAPMDLQRKNFVTDVLAVNERLPDDITLVLEVTERFLLEKHPRIDVVFSILKAHGVKFAIDDFGTHHSNLDLLNRFPFDYVKIDGQFVHQIDKKGCELIRGIAAVSKHYGMEVIAEGVETESQHEALRSLGIPFGQGYFYQRPLPVSMLFAEMREKRSHAVQ